MFDYTCPECRRRQLLPASHIVQLINDDKGITVVVRCWCGELGAMRSGAERAEQFELAS